MLHDVPLAKQDVTIHDLCPPDTYFHNGLNSYLHTITRSVLPSYMDLIPSSRPNKLLRISEHGDITYSIRLTIKAK